MHKTRIYINNAIHYLKEVRKKKKEKREPLNVSSLKQPPKNETAMYTNVVWRHVEKHASISRCPNAFANRYTVCVRQVLSLRVRCVHTSYGTALYADQNGGRGNILGNAYMDL